MDDLCVTKACRNKGIGTMMVNTAVSYAKEKKLSAVLLHVEKTNTGALRLYKRMGFAVFRDDGHRYLMKKDIG
ncbi:MAG: GNAT family N-acetyltransferase [Oscillospiraceae bacterium]|nr:GNAT family N-acetyltransferase [Oscillospiraceae bacterium]